MVGRVTDALPRIDALPLAVANAAALWTAVGTARGDAVERRDSYLAVSGGRVGLRVVMLTATPTADDLAELTARVTAADKALVEDSFNTVDLAGTGLTRRQLPVMVRDRGPALPAPTLPVTRIDGAARGAGEEIVVRGFPLPEFEPYRAGEAFPAALLAHPGAAMYLITREGTPAGACLTITENGVGGIYWVTTAAEHRSHGVGRQLMHAVLADMTGLTVTLTAATAGRPLYDSLAFEVVTPANWWV